MPPSIHFVAGLPRSGSTLLLNLLGQNPLHHVTPTSGLLWMMSVIRDGWAGNEAFRAQGLQNVEPHIPAALRGMSYGFYEEALGRQGKIVFDKNRGWPAHLELLELVYQRPVPVICPVRDIKSVVASFEKLHRKNPVARRPYLGSAYFQAQTTDGRARVLTASGGIVGLSVSYLRDALNRGMQDRVILVPYKDLVTRPVETLQVLHGRLGLPPFQYDPNNVQQITQEDDAVYGWGYDLHTVRPSVEAPSSPPWEGILPPHTCAWLDEEFADVNLLTRTER